MSSFLIISVVGSVILTVLLNLLPALFPKSAEKAERKMLERMQQMHEDRIDPETPKVQVFFPWKAMLAISLFLTVAMNLVGYFAR